MYVLLQSRPGVFKIIGGDTVQMLGTREYLQREGIKVDISTKLMPSLNKYDIVHLFNAPQIHDTYVQALNAKKQKKPLAFSTIYWNLDEFLRWSREELFYELISLQRHGESPKELTKLFLIKHRGTRTIYHIYANARQSFQQRKSKAFLFRKLQTLLNLADVLLPNSRMEAEQITKDFKISGKFRVVPNAADEKFAKANKEAFFQKYGVEDFVLCVARIEKRKNTLSLIRAVNLEGLPLVLIGLEREPKYVKLCEREARKGDVMFIGEIDHDSPLLSSAYHAAKVHALVSWFETPGISSLEAGLAGCNIVTTDRGATKEYFGDMAWYCDPSNISSIRSAIRKAYDSEKSEKLKTHIMKNYTWKRAAELTIQAYEEII